jgi:hypothetical protein
MTSIDAGNNISMERFYQVIADFQLAIADFLQNSSPNGRVASKVASISSENIFVRVGSSDFVDRP